MRDLIRELKNCLKIYWRATGVGVMLLDREGRALESYGTPSPYCSLIQQEPEQQERCACLHVKAGREAEKNGECYFFSCHGNMMHVSIALIDHGNYIGSVLAGPMLAEYPSAATLDEVIKNCSLPSGCRSLFLDAMKDIQVVEPERMYYLGELLFHLLYHLLSGEDVTRIQRSRDKKRQQEMIGLAIQSMKASGEIRDNGEMQRMEVLRRMQERQEKDLSDYLAQGNLAGAQDILNDILGNIYFTSGDINLIKLRINELLTVLTRRVIQNGASAGHVYKLVNEFQKKSAGQKEVEELSYSLAQLLPRLITMLRTDSDRDLPEPIQVSLRYIHEHYRSELTLEEAAGYAGTSPTYFSRIFKASMGIGFISYVNRLRVQKAKELLLETTLSLSEITQSVGFGSQQYFTRVFKQETGQTPGEYRKASETAEAIGNVL